MIAWIRAHSLSAALSICSAAAIVSIVGCQNPTGSFNPNATANPTYSSISSVILSPACVSCHGGSGGYSFDSYQHTMKGVTAGDPSTSVLYTSVSGGRMPKGGPTLSAEQVQAISDWITAGASNN